MSFGSVETEVGRGSDMDSVGGFFVRCFGALTSSIETDTLGRSFLISAAPDSTGFWGSDRFLESQPVSIDEIKMNVITPPVKKSFLGVFMVYAFPSLRLYTKMSVTRYLGVVCMQVY